MSEPGPLFFVLFLAAVGFGWVTSNVASKKDQPEHWGEFWAPAWFFVGFFPGADWVADCHVAGEEAAAAIEGGSTRPRSTSSGRGLRQAQDERLEGRDVGTHKGYPYRITRVAWVGLRRRSG